LELVLNSYAVLQPSIGREDGAVVCTIRLRMKFWNTVVVAASSLLLFALVGYVFLENFAPRF
ncbi:MAG: hypothetical protein LC751_21045, partial [Actinobacteria bacterium]|nr:hypothetical protein [Actinomycetota bacterium]